MRAAAERVRTAYADVRAGGTHQARLERDIAWDVTQRRLSDLDIGESPLVFGRLDLERGVRWYVGRLAVEDEGHTPLVVDWRAPVAEPFYRATAVEPMSVVRRRHLITRKGREVTGLDDEVFDQIAVEDEGLRVAGEGALLAALERNRTGRMGDIVATIQARTGRGDPRRRRRHPHRGRGSGHRQDRGRAAPRRVPPLHAPAPARGPGRAAHRSEPRVPPLHRAGAPVARRAGRAAVDDLRA